MFGNSALSHISIRKKIQACANKFLRIIFFLKPRDSVRTIMKENKLLSVNQIYHLEISKLMQKLTLKSLPSPFYDIFKSQTRTTGTFTRSGTTILQASFSTMKCAQSIRCSGPKIWNDVPIEIRYLPTSTANSANSCPTYFNSFVSQMKSYALNHIDFI